VLNVSIRSGHRQVIKMYNKVHFLSFNVLKYHPYNQFAYLSYTRACVDWNIQLSANKGEGALTNVFVNKIEYKRNKHALFVYYLLLNWN